MKGIPDSNYKYYLMFAGYFLGFGVLVALLTSFINYNIKYTDIQKQLSQRSFQETTFKKQFLKDYIKEIELVLKSIAQNGITEEYVRTKNDSDRQKMNNLFFSLIFSNPDIMQLRYINEKGIEEIRIDRNKKLPTLKVFKPEEMQDKSNRYYFHATSNILPESFWHSKVDLNVEHGKVEVPHKPTFRVATPLILFNKFQGILIVNINMNNILTIMTRSLNFHIHIIDKEGEVIISPDKELSWSRYLEGRPKITETIPKHADLIMHSSELQLENLFMYDYSPLFNNGEGIKLLLEPRTEVVGKLKLNNILTALLIAGIVLIVSIPLSWIVSVIPSRLQSRLAKAYEDIKRYTDIIDRNIATSSTDKNGNITAVSRKFLEMTGFTREEVIGKDHNILRHPETKENHYRELWQTINKGYIWQGEMRDKTKAGNTYWIKQTITPEIGAKGEVLGYTSVAQDITDKKIIEEMSITDRLTGLYNRHKLDDALLSEVNRFTRYKSSFSVLLLDVDHFKRVNDTYGHQMGDDVLMGLADIIKENTRTSDVAGRWGGEEFIVLAIESTIEDAKILAEKLRAKVENKEFHVDQNITISIGVAQYEYGETISHFINRADDALYKAKKTGRNKVVIHEEQNQAKR